MELTLEVSSTMLLPFYTPDELRYAQYNMHSSNLSMTLSS